jgi:hypothetical protein
MAKLTNVRERVHQPFYDTLIRTAGLGFQPDRPIQSRELLFINRGTDSARTNLLNGSTLPSDQSHVTLALRVFLWFRNPMIRSLAGANGLIGASGNNGDFSQEGAGRFFDTGAPGFGNAPGNIEDVYRLYYQASEQIHWTYGTGEKPSISNMASKFFPDGNGLDAALGGSSDLVHLNNGSPTHQSILRLARAVLLPPRQNVKVVAEMYGLPDGSQAALAGTTTTTGRNMLDITSNLNAIDGVNKVVQFCFDGLFARDVQ